ncbi:MAG TPA: chloride channel protein [Methanomassiliicoccales archaeon]|nr:chloride channel protein [Methanomassiliicoccales archaeon]
MTNDDPNQSRTAHFLRRGYQGIVTADFKDYLRKWIPLSILIGVGAGFGALAFQWLLLAIWHLSYDATEIPWYLRLFLPAIGGLIAGIVISRFSPEAAGGGTGYVIEAIHHHGGRVRPRSGLVKILASAVTIGTGGSAGREGPIMHIGAAISSFFGDRLKLKKGDMRTFAIAGAAAGLSAVFRAPLGAAIYAIEVPYKNDLEPGAVIPSMIASVVSYLVFVPFNGYEPLFEALDIHLEMDLVIAVGIILLGILIGLAGRLFISSMQLTERLIKRSSLPLPSKIMYGGLVVGCIGLFVPQVLGLAENEIGMLIKGSITSIGFLLTLFVMKMVATSVTVGSGGSGGVFFPSLMMGGALGSAFALVLGLTPIPLFAIAGMGAMMAGVSKTPIAASVFMAEVIGGYTVLIPVMLASVVSYIVTGDQTLFRNQVARRPFIYDPGVLDDVPVELIMRRNPIALTPEMSVEEARRGTAEEPHYLYPVVNVGGMVVGVMLREVLDEYSDPSARIGYIMSRHYEKVRAGTSTFKAFEDMNIKQISRMLVVGQDNGILLGMLTRIDIMEYLEHSDEVHHLY